MSDDDTIVQELIESGSDGGRWLGWYCKGHWEPHEFCHMVNDGYGLSEYDKRYCWPNHVRQVYYRTVRVPGDDGMYEFQEVDGPARGAWAVTVADIHAQRIAKDWQKDCDIRDRARRQALDWVLWFQAQNEGRAPTDLEMKDWTDSMRTRGS